MNNNSLEAIESIAIRQHDAAVHMAQTLLDALSKGQINKELAFSLLDEVRNLIKCSYEQRIEACMAMGLDIDKLEDMKRDDLQSLDKAAYQTSQEEMKHDLDAETKEQLENLFR